MSNPFEHKAFVEKSSGVRYTFGISHLWINSKIPYVGHYGTYKENGRLYLHTEPHVASHDLFIIAAANTRTILLRERNVNSRKPFAILVEM